MPFLAPFLASIFSSLFGFIAAYASKKIAVGAAVAATLLTVTTTFYVLIQTFVQGIGYAVTNEWLLMGFYAVLPSNAATCITAMFASEVAAFLYRHQLMTIKAISSSN